MKSQIESQWKGIWRDDRGRFVEIEPFETPEGLIQGHFLRIERIGKELYRDGNHTLDGSKLMERKRGDEAGWPL